MKDQYFSPIPYCILVVSILGLLWFAPPAIAASCHALNGHSVCIIRIQRSAKYFWEYRVVSTIDGLQQPETIYDCRDRLKTEKGQQPVPFESDGIGEWICRLLKHA